MMILAHMLITLAAFILGAVVIAISEHIKYSRKTH